MSNFPKNFRRVEGEIYAGGTPDANFLSFFKRNLNGNAVLSLDAGVAAQIAPIVKQLGMQHFIIPLEASMTHVTDDLKHLITSIRNGLLTSNQPIYVHCLHGRDRTGFTIALHRVMKDGWSCDGALNEARRYGYGNGIPVATQMIWKSVLCIKTDNNAANDDAVTTMRDDFDGGNVAPAYDPQQSFAPFVGRSAPSFTEYVSVEPEYIPSGIEHEDRKSKLRRYILENMTNTNEKIPMVGQHSNVGPIGGAGIIENSGIMQIL